MKLFRNITLVVAAAFAGGAQAAPTFYSSEAAFLAGAAGITLQLENFENSIPVGNNTNVMNSFASGLNISSNTTLQYNPDDNSCAGTGDCVLFATPAGGSSQTFTFDSGAVNAFGIFLGDLGTIGGTTLVLSNQNGSSATFNIPSSPSDNERYFGVIDFGDSFTSATITNSSLGDAAYIDNVRWGSTVPEPATLLLLGAALLGMAGVRRRG